MSVNWAIFAKTTYPTVRRAFKQTSYVLLRVTV